MIALTSIPFSFSAFWRFLVVLPIFVPIAFAVVLTYSLILPGLSGVLLSVTTAFATLMAIRGGFHARGVSRVSVFITLLVSSIKWGLLEGLLYAAIGIGMVFALSVASPLGVPLLRGLVRNPDPHAVWLFLTSSPRVMAVMLVGLGLIYGLSVAFSVPKAAAAYSAGEKARPLDFF